MRRNKLVMAAALAAALTFGATSAEAGTASVLKGILTYAKDRVYDTMDVVRLRVGMPRDGKGIGAKARVTSLAQLGFVTFDGKYIGLDRRGLGLVDERRREGGISIFYGSYNEMEPVVGNGFLRANDDWSAIQDRRILRNLPHWDDGRQRHLSIGAEAVLPIIAVDAGIYPEEILDLALGFVLVDIYDDDTLFGYNVKYRDATTDPGPKLDAPFAEKQARNAAFKKQMEEKKLAEEEMEKEAENAERLSQSAKSETSPATRDENVGPTPIEASDVAPHQPESEETNKSKDTPKSPKNKDLITDEAADQATKELEEQAAEKVPAISAVTPTPTPVETPASTPTPEATPAPDITPEPVVTEPPPTPEPEPTESLAPTPTPEPSAPPPPSPTAAPEPTETGQTPDK
ncbi:hypothetical protein IT570_06965 [Candidatus Sumerlaeota bacterium]|nr:hypothetical protein [Candidatus Sumerlaeota bacterium]